MERINGIIRQHSGRWHRRQNKFGKLWQQTEVTVRLARAYFNLIWVHSCKENTAAQRAEERDRSLKLERLNYLSHTLLTHYQTLESIFSLLLCGQGNSVLYHCQTKSESAISHFLNNFKWSTRSLIRTVHSFLLHLIFSEVKRGRKPRCGSNSGFNYTIIGGKFSP